MPSQRTVIATVSAAAGGALTAVSRASQRAIAWLPTNGAMRISCGVSIESLSRPGWCSRGTPSGAASVGSVSIALRSASSPASTSMCWMRAVSLTSCTA